MLAYVEDLAELSGLKWFSTEVCLSEGDEPSRYAVHGPDGRERPVLAIDYVNDQCDVDVQNRWAGAPPEGPVFDFSEAGVRRSLDESLERMGLDRHVSGRRFLDDGADFVLGVHLLARVGVRGSSALGRQNLDPVIAAPPKDHFLRGRSEREGEREQQGSEQEAAAVHGDNLCGRTRSRLQVDIGADKCP